MSENTRKTCIDGFFSAAVNATALPLAAECTITIVFSCSLQIKIQTGAASVAAGSARHKQSHTSVCLKTPPLPSQQEITQCYNEGAGLYVEN